MPAAPALIDSGPLFALFDRSDSFHKTAVAFIRSWKHGFITNLGVVSEVHFLLQEPAPQQAFLRWLSQSPVAIEAITLGDLGHLADLMAKYDDVAMDLADGMLVVQAERLGIDRIATVDSDFTIYRLKKREPFVNVFPLQR